MSFANPTPLRIGMSGALAGHRYRVVGRVVMGMEEGRETYYWNEFNVVNEDGEPATLVYEETERGGEWRMFKLFEPEYPIAAADASAKRVGDPLNLDGTNVRVTLVDESRVFHIEGEAPEGVEVGDVAHYFNAEAGNKMQVVSWTGDEVECYHGLNLPRSAVASGFGFRTETANETTRGFSQTDGYDGDASTLSGVILKCIGVALGAAILFAGYSSCRSPRQRAEVKKASAQASPLALGGEGKLNGKSYRIQSHALVEIAEVGRLFDRHEYQILDEDGNRALLVFGTQPNAKDWLLLTPLSSPPSLTAQQAAALRVGERVNLQSYALTVDEIFQTTIRQLEYGVTALPGLKQGDVLFGFQGRSGPTVLLARWNNSGILFYHGKTLPTKDVIAAFEQKARN